MFIRSFLVWSILLTGWQVVVSQNFNRPVPPGVPPYEFEQYDSSDYGNYLMAPFRLGAGQGGPSKPAMILDASGYLLWYLPLAGQNVFDFKYHPDFQQYSLIRFVNPQFAQFILLDAALLPVDTFYTTNGVLPDPHEFTISSNHTFLISGVKDSVMDLSGYTFKNMPGSPQTNVIGFVVQEYDQDHHLIFEWNSSDHIHPSNGYDFYGYDSTAFDYAHGNAVFEDIDGNLLVSCRNTNAVYKVERPTGRVLWSLGGKTSSFTFSGDNGFSGQHDVQVLPNGHVTLFDNGNMNLFVKFSRAVEYALDTVTWKAQQVWQHRPQPFLFAPALGNHQTTEERNHLINYGLVYRPAPSFELMDDNENKLTALFFKDSVVSYRCFLEKLPVDQLPRPLVTCVEHDGILTLSAPAGYEKYMWSNGSITASIDVATPGTYQVWVNYGAGMLGSLPLKIDDPSSYCLATGTIDSVQHAGEQTILAVYDFLGRVVERPTPGGWYVVRYKNGDSRIVLMR